MTRLLVPALLLAAAGVARADQVRAVVVDGTTLVPIPRARVRIEGREVVAGDDGIVTAEVTGPVDAAASAQGYEGSTQRIEPGGSEPTMLLLFVRGALDEVVEVRGIAPSASTGSAYTLGRDEIRNMPGGRSDALAAVRSLPGIGAATPLAAGRLVIRGGAPQDSLLTIDGVPVPFVYHAFDHSTILPVSMIGAISYSPGGFGVENGRATSGTVSLLTTDEPPARPTAAATLSMTDLAATAATPLSTKHHVYLSGGVRRSTVDVLMPLVLPDDSPLSFTVPPRYSDAQLKLDWQPGVRDRVTLLAFTSYDRLGVVNAMPGNDLPSDFATDASYTRAIASWKHESPGVRNRLVAAAGGGDFHATFDTVQFVNETQSLALVRDDAVVDLTRGGELRLRAGAFGQLEHHDLSARTVIIPPDGLPPGRFSDLPIKQLATAYDTSYAAAYVAADVRPTESTTISAGARVDHFARIAATVLEPRAEVVQRLGTMTLRASAGRYARDHAQAFALDTSLAPEVATQLAGGTEIQLADGLTAQATVYRTTRDQLAVPDQRMTGPDTVPYRSTGSGTSTGVDLLLRLSRDDLFAWLAYSYGKTSERDHPGADAHATPFDQTHVLTALASYRTGAWRFGARFQFATGLPYTDVLGGMYSEELQRYLPVMGAPFGTRYPDVAQLDLRVERTWSTKHAQIAAFVDIANVFRSAQVHRYRYSDDFSSREAVAELVPLPSVGVRGEF